MVRVSRKAPSHQCSALHSFSWLEDRCVTCQRSPLLAPISSGSLGTYPGLLRVCSSFSHLTFILSHSGVFSPSWSLGTPAPLTLIFGRRHDPFIHSFIHLTPHPSRSSGHPQIFLAGDTTLSFILPPTCHFTLHGPRVIPELSCSRRSSPFILISSLSQSLTSQSTTRKEYLLV